MRILVTGGAGYVGSVTVERLVNDGIQVVVLDNLSTGHRDAVDLRSAFVHCDISNREHVREILSEYRPDAVMHFAARSQVGQSMEQPFLYLGDNVQEGLAFFQECVDFGIRRFVLSSTANLFGSPRNGDSIDETEKVDPGSPYGESKFILERALQWMERIYGIRFATLRYFNAAGATERFGEDHNPETHLIPLCLQVASGKREKIIIFGNDYPTQDGTCVRDYVHVSDLADAHIKAVKALEERSRCYNLGAAEGASVRQVIDAVQEIAGRPIRWEIGARRPGDIAELVANPSQIKSDLGWEPSRSTLKNVILTSWQWIKTHPNGYLA